MDSTIDKQTARRFILGRTGLWPGRRWRGMEGTVSAVGCLEALQLDPLNIVARSQEIALWGRVVDYRLGMLEKAAYEERKFFDYGGWLAFYPMAELPYWQFHMRRAASSPHWAAFAREHPDSIATVRGALRERGPLGNRDFEGSKRFTGNYRGRKDTSLALYYLWITGEVMVHHREGFSRYYDLRERVVPPGMDREVTEEEAIAHFGRKAAAFRGLLSRREWANIVSDYIQRKLSPEETNRRLSEQVEAGALVPVRVEGWKDLHYLPGEDLPQLETVAAGGTPPAWQPLDGTTEREAVFLAPLDIVVARDRAPVLFDFAYRWEVYIPIEQRRWGYYNIPVLYGDRLVARIAPRMERKTGTLQVTGFWPEEDFPVEDADFASALARALRSFAKFVEAKQIELDALQPGGLRQQIDLLLKVSTE